MSEDTHGVTVVRADQFSAMHPHCCRVLLQMATSPALSPRATARALKLEVATVKWALGELAELGLVAPASGTEAANAKRFVLTALGRIAVSTVREIVSARKWSEMSALQSDINFLQEALRSRFNN